MPELILIIFAVFVAFLGGYVAGWMEGRRELRADDLYGNHTEEQRQLYACAVFETMARPMGDYGPRIVGIWWHRDGASVVCQERGDFTVRSLVDLPERLTRKEAA